MRHNHKRQHLKVWEPTKKRTVLHQAEYSEYNKLYTVSSGARPVTTIGPSTTADATNIIPTSAPGPTAPEGRGGSNCGEGAKTPSTGVIAGAVVGGLLGIGLIATALR